jgi:hypothetical protein
MLHRLYDQDPRCSRERSRSRVSRYVAGAILPLAMAGGLLVAGAGSASAAVVITPPPVNVAPNATVNPNVQTGLCGNGVGVFGSGTQASCSGSQSPTPAPESSANVVGSDGLLSSDVDATSSAATDVCGTGVGVFGTGTTSNCDATSGSDGTGSDGPTPASSRMVRSGICGNGAGLFGAGSTGRCNAANTTHATNSDMGTSNADGFSDPSSSHAAGSNASNAASDNPGAFASGMPILSSFEAHNASAATPAFFTAGPLAFTGAGAAATGLFGSVLLAIGGFLLRARRLV